MASAFKVGDRLIMLHEGKLMADAPRDSFAKIELPIVQRFIHGQATDDELALAPQQRFCRPAGG